MEENTHTEEFQVSGSQLVDKIKDLVHQGNVRRIVIRQEGRTILELPVTVAAVGTMFAPVLAAVGAFAALVSSCTIAVERVVEE